MQGDIDATETGSQLLGARLRTPNGALSALITIFFLCHAALGTAWQLGLLSDSAAFIVWVGVAAIILHMVLSLATSYSMLTDQVRPPSAQKRRHLLLKWVTGGAIAVLAATHIAAIATQGAGANSGWEASALMVAVLVALAVHGCTGAKSLLKDMGIARRRIMPLRIAIIVVSCIIGIAALL